MCNGQNWSERTKWTQIQNKIMRKNVQWSEWWTVRMDRSGHKLKVDTNS